MGNSTSYSQLPAFPPGFPYFVMVFRESDKLILLRGSEEHQVVDIVREKLKLMWTAGLDSESDEHGVYTFTLGGLPFTSCSSRESALAIKRFCCEVLSALKAQLGWRLAICTELSRIDDVCTWFFHRKDSLHSPIDARPVCGLSVSSTEALQLINAPPELNAVIARSADLLLKKEKVISVNEFEIKMHGEPWDTSEIYESVNARRLLLRVIRAFDQNRYRLIGRANLKRTTDTLFFEQESEQDTGVAASSATSDQRQYWMMSLDGDDRLRLIDAPTEIDDLIGTFLAEHWIHGIKDGTRYTSIDCHEFQLNGSPWSSAKMDVEKPITVRALFTALLQELLAHGWALHSSLDVSRKKCDTSVLVFGNCTAVSVPHFCLSPNEKNKLWTINAPKQIQQLIADALIHYWPAGIEQQFQVNAMTFEFQLRGVPWHSKDCNDYAIARYMLCMLLNDLAIHGWRVIASVDVNNTWVEKTGSDYPLDVNCWFLAFTGVPTGYKRSMMSASAPDDVQLQIPGEAPPSYMDVVGNTDKF